jgi:hypothetical protein
MRIENATPVAIVITVLHSAPLAGESTAAEPLALVSIAAELPSAELKSSLPVPNTNDAMGAAPPELVIEAALPKTEAPSEPHEPVNAASAASLTDTFEMGSLAATIGQIGFIPVGIQPADTAALVEGRSIQSMKPTLCQVRVLAAVNRRFPSANLTTANILPVDSLDPRFSVSNVNIQGTPTQLARVNKGRYLPRRRMFFGLLIGYGPSLHIVSHPSFLDPHALVFSPTAFTAHLDSAWADTPVGLFLHFVLDVLRPKARNPCP